MVSSFTPKERLEMQPGEEIRRREEERDEKDKRWRQEQEQVAADRQKKQRDVDRTWQEDQAKKARKWAIFTACIGPTLAAVFSVIAYMIGAGKAPPPPQEIRVVYPPPANQPAD